MSGPGPGVADAAQGPPPAAAAPDAQTLEDQIELWREAQGRHRAISPDDLAELEDHLRGQIADLEAAGLDGDEAFLVAAKRLGNVDAVSREFAREHSGRLWRQLALDSPTTRRWGLTRDVAVMLALAAGAGVTVCAFWAALRAGADLGLVAGAGPDWADARAQAGSVMDRDIGLLTAPWLVAYLAHRRGLARRTLVSLAAVVAVMAAAVNLFPFRSAGSTADLTALHLLVALWLLVGVAYCGGWRAARRGLMDFVRFSGELAIYYGLIALGGGVFSVLTFSLLDSLGVDAYWVLEDWVLPTAAPAALIVAAWLVDAKQSVVENLAPVLTKVFTPLSAAMLAVLAPSFALAAARDVGLVRVDRGQLIMVDAILILVAALLLYAASAREALARPGFFDWLQLGLVAAALVVDAIELAAMMDRIAEFGSSPNKLAALGLNILLAAHLAGSGWLGLRFALGRAPFVALERWHTGYLPLYGLWAAFVALAFPPIFGFS
ncbi:MAG: permease prefix domain 1-containing protein [Bifidobacteriaceae bacterium]|jgi:hypothetical protein|nr:permease prefix domain 1-containing protein [Bifidobacteriaceae bacterium]